MQSDSITIEPSTIQVIFQKTNHTKFNIQNISLHQTSIKIFVDNPQNYNIQPNQILLDSFDEKSINITIKYTDQSIIQNYKNNKIHIFYYNFDQEGQIWNPNGNNVQTLKLIKRLQLNIHTKTQDQQSEEDDHYFSLHKSIPLVKITRIVGANPISNPLKNQLINFIEKFGNLKNIQSLQNGDYLATFVNVDGNLPSIKQFIYHDKVAIYIIALTMKQQNTIDIPKIVEDKKQPQNVKNQLIENKITEVKVNNENKITEEERNNEQFKPSNRKKNLQNFQSFVVESSNDPKRSFGINKKKKRNKSLQMKKKIIQQTIEQFGEEDQENSKKQFNQLIKKRLTEIQADRIKKQLFRQRQKQLETNKNIQYKKSQIEENQIKPNLTNFLVINCIQSPIGLTFSTESGYFYIIFQTFIQIYNLSDKLMVLRRIEIDKITYDSSKKLIIKEFGYKIVVANDAYFYIIDLDTECSEWTYVQRKQIYDFTLIKNLDMLAIGGRNFSKLSVFGKQTNRSNLKIYSFSDHYRHLFTYDIQGAGDICTVEYLKIQNKNLLFVFGKHEDRQTIFLIKPVNWNEYKILNKFDVNELGIKQIKSFRFSNSNIYALQSMLINVTKMMVLKKFNIRIQGQKINLFTQSIPTLPQVYNYFENDKETLVLYSIAREQLTILHSENRASHRFRLQKGFKELKVHMPYIFLLQESQIYIQILS